MSIRRPLFFDDIISLVRQKLNSEANFEITRGIFLILVFSVLAKSVGAVKEMAVAWRYGIGETVDAYIFVFNLLALPVSVWFGAIFAALVPILSRQTDEHYVVAPQLKELAGGNLIIGQFVGLFAALVIWLSLHLGWSGLKPETVLLGKSFVLWMWLSVPLLFVANFFACRLMAAKRFGNSALEAMPSLFILVFVLFVPFDHGWPMVGGFVMGCAVQSIVCGLLLKDTGSWFKLPKIQSPLLKELKSPLKTVLFTQILISSSIVIDMFIAGRLSTGSIATFGYATRVAALALTLLSTAVGRAILPTLSTVSRKQPENLIQISARWSVMMFICGSVISAAIFFLAHPIVELLFQRGAFGEQDTAAVAEILSILILQLPFAVSVMVLTQMNFSSGHFQTITIMAIGTIVVKLTTGIWLSSIWGISGLAASVVFVAIFQLVFLIARTSLQKRTSVTKI